MTVGSRAEVYHGNANATSGGLTKKDLMMKDGRITVSYTHLTLPTILRV